MTEPHKPYEIYLKSQSEDTYVSGVEVAMHVLAQCTRFVHRKYLTPKEAALLSIEMAKAFVDEINNLEETK